MSDDSASKKEHVAIPSWAIAIMVSIAIAGAGNLAAIGSWKGALETDIGSLKRSNDRVLALIENLPGRISVLEAQRTADEREWRSRGEDMTRRVTDLENLVRADMRRRADTSGR